MKRWLNTSKININLKSLTKSKFRNNFKLKQKDKEYIDIKVLETIEKCAHGFIEKRLSSRIIPNDGKQNPMRGHPVFIAQHAMGTCCLKCLYK